MLEEPTEKNWAVREREVEAEEEAKDKREEDIEERSGDKDKEERSGDKDTERNDGKAKGKEGDEEETEEELQKWRVSYQNVGRSIETTNILLEKARQEKKRDLIFVAEA